jgi:hypothetical protein
MIAKLHCKKTLAQRDKNSLDKQLRKPAEIKLSKRNILGQITMTLGN